VPGTAANPRTIAIAAGDDDTFSPNIVYLAENETVRFHVTNNGATEHGFTIGAEADVFASPSTSRATATIQPGASADVTYHVVGLGPFAFASHSDGDLAAGQVGYVVVVDPTISIVGTDTAPRLVGLIAGASGFNRPTLSIAKGETLTFLVSNAATETREFIVGPADKVAAVAIDQVSVVTTGPIKPGQVKPVTYTFPASGGSYGYATHAIGATGTAGTGTITFH
jgi:FtsP/CotA-like multicopper oxidase with cupredoxin domain